MSIFGVTFANGQLLAKVQFEKVYDYSSKKANWKSNIVISDSLDAADEIANQESMLPTVQLLSS